MSDSFSKMPSKRPAPIVIGFVPQGSTSNFGLSQEHTPTSCASNNDNNNNNSNNSSASQVMASPLSRNTSGRSNSSPGLLSLQLSLQHESKGYDDYYASDYDSDEDYSDAEGEFCLSRAGGVSNSTSRAAPADEAAGKPAHSQPIAIPTTMWIKDPAASTACCLLQRERAIRRQQYEQSEAYARQQHEWQIRQQQYQQYQQLQQQQQLLLAQRQQYLYAQGQL